LGLGTFVKVGAHFCVLGTKVGLLDLDGYFHDLEGLDDG
jgi:Mrp family chromosome partitioning ATPase